MKKHAVVIAGGGPTGMMLAAELALAGIERYAGLCSGLDIHYDLGSGHPLLGRRIPDLDIVTDQGPQRIFTLLHAARPVLLSFDTLIDIAPWADRVTTTRARYSGQWLLPVIGAVAPPRAVLIRPDGYVAWVAADGRAGLHETLTAWFGSPGQTP